MANPDRQLKPKVHRSEQDVQNSSFDETFQVSTVELLAYNSNSNSLDRVQINNSGEILTNASLTGSGGDGAILDGASSLIKATVLDYTNSNPLAVRLTDTNGDYIAAGAGTQYTEDAAAAANPVGTALNLVRDDARGGSLTTTDGDNVAARGTNAGELYVKHVDSIAVTNSGLTELAAAINASSQVDVNIAASGATVPVSNAGLTALNGAISGTEVQVDVLTMPTTTVQATNLDIRDLSSASDSVTAETELTTADLDTGAGTDTRAVVGLVGTASGGGQLIPGSATDGLLVNLGANNDVTVTGSVTANAGTNLNTSTLALESGGNLATATTSLGVIDDWDESDRAKVNPIVGQAGVQGGSGAVSTTTQRVVLATDVALPAGTNAIGKLAANSGVDIGDVDVTSIIPGTATTSLGKAEDGGHTTGDTGVAIWGVRNNTPNSAATNADADYSQLSTDMVGGIRTALYETDFAVLGTNHVKKYYTNSGAVTDGIVWSPAAGKRWYVTDIFINVSAAATVTLEDDLAAGDSVVWKAELAANSGWSHHYGTPLFSGEDAADLLITTSAGNVYVSITGYEI